MIRQKPSAAMQKTYDDCYLVCSTAIYFESQGNEAEALRSWRNALDQIYYFNAYRRPANWAPKTETEKALQASLRELELQCKERVDLLEALKESRKDAKKEKDPASAGDLQASSAATSRPEVVPDGGGWLGQGTIPPVNYPDLARPPPLPKRPSEEGGDVEDVETNAEGRKKGVVIVSSVRLEREASGSGKGGNTGLGLYLWPE
ncbi:putative aaa family [Diplodia seriata]|uniref:Putative aaa family n=1 Tax=Diplodia seriata TaxID=420778 RepID=A0A0G2GTL1_9PEZI|nr:putative aaa family [Diplodia seriata]